MSDELPAPETASDRAEAPTLALLDVDGVTTITYGTIAWLAALVLCLVARQPLADAGRGWWQWVCVIGAVLGLAGLVYVRRRRAAYARAAHH
ncbi:unannotated protein [freshwater metagenome]|uniref:Unannotated protein n=1 Tax=freshwater metagenome TaxID=449393 RepID=A0A6J7R3X5_9ZZZZ|nr:DUF2530 domain-containing protein [Actinomycetota bacterium]MSW35774.1 DUF2530 domain-containing protein [Actinomycetota bacterium]MSX38862.1 DUF2530 domain-containing protein [Actinomycetota bacterium]